MQRLDNYAYICREMQDTRTIDRLFRTDYRPLCLYALHYVDSLNVAEDIVTASFEALWNKLSEGSPIANPRAYLYSSVRNASLDHLRKAASMVLDPRDLDGIISDEEARDRSSVEAKLWTAIDRMPARRREILLMAKRDGMSYSEISRALGISENTVRNTLEAALKSLRVRRKEILDFVFLV